MIFEILKQTDSLNIELNQKRIILKALVITDFSIEKAFLLNCKNAKIPISVSGYTKKIHRYFPQGARGLKKEYEKYLLNS